jgi:hypothetical protein
MPVVTHSSSRDPTPEQGSLGLPIKESEVWDRVGGMGAQAARLAQLINPRSPREPRRYPQRECKALLWWQASLLPTPSEGFLARVALVVGIGPSHPAQSNE